jgi:hypothetical protein
MAIEYLTIVWQMSPYKAEKLLAQLAFADWANLDGVFYPSVIDLAQKARLTERGAIQIIQQMLTDGEIELVKKGGGRGNPNQYRFAEHYREAVVKLSRNWAARRAVKTSKNPERETVFETANTEPHSVNGQLETLNEKQCLKQQTLNENAINPERESSAYKELSPSCIPSIKNPLEREGRAHFSADAKSAGGNAANYEPNLDEIEKALCQVVGWIPDLLDPMQYSGVRSAAKTIRSQPSVISSQVALTVERISRAREFYQSQKKFSFAPSWIARDWAGLLAWIEARGNSHVNRAAHLEEARKYAFAEIERREKRRLK